jgi:hypothetical protein
MTDPVPTSPRLDEAATRQLAAEAERLFDAGDHAAIARRLGGHGDGSRATFGLWVPDDGREVQLELLLPPPGFEGPPETPERLDFERVTLPMTVVRDTAWTAVTDIAPGRRDRFGPLYRAIVDGTDERRPLIDPMAVSTPFGAFAPSELVDVNELFGPREDMVHVAALASESDGPPRLGPFVNILQVHVGTATEEGTLEALTERVSAVAERIRQGQEPAPAEMLWTEYDAVQLMPVEPTIRREAGPFAFTIEAQEDAVVSATVRRETASDWGYDVIIGGSAAVNPAILRHGRPHALSDLARCLHDFPGGPIHLILDMVFGHADNQATQVMPSAWFTGPDMYGQHLDYRHPLVRAQLLEMQRRKLDHGADGFRIDGAQDFTWWNVEHQRVEHDDDFLEAMSAVVQEVGGVRYRPWMIFEDGRPWPRDDWEIASTYRAVTERQPHAFQWGPLTFAHNTPFLFTFWLMKWWRLREVAQVGSHWISGCANHDTLRRGTQVDPHDRINTYLGGTRPEAIRQAYDHPAANLLFGAFLPGVPMDFLQAIARAPWSFIRDTDHRYAVKVWAEESRFLDWHVPADVYEDPEVFVRLKGLGFRDRELLAGFMADLAAAVAVHGDALEPVVERVAVAPRPAGFGATAGELVAASHAWMQDVRDFCRVDRHLQALDPRQVRFDADVRRFRREHAWLQHDLGEGDRFEHRHPSRGSALFYGHRQGPAGERVLFVANMEGAPVEVVAAELVGVTDEPWTVALASPGLAEPAADRRTRLDDGEGFVCLAAS